MTMVRVPREGFRLLSGEELISVFRPDGGAVKAFCSVCGSSLFGAHWPEGEEISIRLGALDEAGVRREAVTVMPVPGAFELPLAAMALAKTRRFACVVALGCIVRGETPHFDFIASEAASGLQLAALETGVPVAFGVLTVDMVEQAEARISKGAEAVRTALEMADAFAQLRASASR